MIKYICKYCGIYITVTKKIVYCPECDSKNIKVVEVDGRNRDNRL